MNDTLEKKIAFLGAGNMAGALISGITAGGAVAAERIWATDPHEARLEELTKAHGIRTGTDNAEAARWAEVVVLAVKPQKMGELFADLEGVLGPEHLTISVAAGVTIGALKKGLGAQTRVVRAMPNTPALVHAGITAFARGEGATDVDADVARTLFSQVGDALELEERLLDAVTGLSGSGPAYVFRLIEGMVAGGERAGLESADALRLAARTVLGAAKLLIDSGESPSSLRQKVTSPNGTTEAGLAHLAEHGFLEAVEGAIGAATARSVSLGQEIDELLGGVGGERR
jgi:pyrroline-5-carboxylate reductase